MGEVNYEILARPFPREAIKQRRGANGMSLSYVETHTVIRRLVEATGNCFDFRVLNIEQAPDLVMVTVELQIGNSTRQHVGSARTAGNAEDCVKAAISDAIKKCATLFSVGLELYGPDYEAERPQAAASARPAQTRPVTASPAQTRPVAARPAATGGNGGRTMTMPTDRGAYRPS